MKPPKISLPVAGMSFKSFALTLAGLWLIATLASYGVRLTAATTDSSWALTTAQAIAYISGAALAVFLLWGLWSFAIRIARFVLPWLLATKTVDLDPAPPPVVEEAPAIEQNLAGLDHILAGFEQDASAASLNLLDAYQYASNLVALIRGIVLKAEAMQAEVATLQAAIEAVLAQDALRLAAAAGQVEDRHIRELLLCDAQLSNSYWLGVTRLISTQLGTIEQWSAAYDKFAAQLITEVSSQKARLAALTATLELANTARPLLLAQEALNQAQVYLQPQHRPELVPAFKTLPPINARLLKGGAS
jgi:hypothetical protein